MRRALHVLFALSAVYGQPYDLLITGGRIVDGTGNPAYYADIAVRDQRIAAIGKLDGQPAKRTINAKGLTVTPGFVDIHNHSDYTIAQDGDAQSMIRQGVTSMIFGEGGSVAPVGGKQGTGSIEDRPRGAWTDLTSYFDLLKRRGISANIGTYVGSSQIWTYVRGPNPGPPTKDELAAMKAEVEKAMRQGALGVASSLSGPPGAWIDTESLIAMCSASAPFGGVYSTHMRTEGQGVFESVAEALEIGRRAGVPVDIIHLKLADHKLWGKMPELIGLIANARASGQQVEANVYPYRAGQNNLSSILPPWVHAGGPQALIGRLKDPALRPRLEREVLNGIPGSNWYNHYTATGSWEGMLLVSLSNPAYKKFEGRRMNEVIATLKKPPVDTLFDLLINNAASVPTVYFHHSEEDMRYAMKQPFVSIGSDGAAVAISGPLSAGNPHPRWYGTFPRVLGRYVREDKVITLEEAIRKMTSANTAKVGVFDRGILRPGQWADITIFDATKVIDNATYDKPHQYPSGIEYVIVNGTPVLNAEKHMGTRPGAILYGRGKVQ